MNEPERQALALNLALEYHKSGYRIHPLDGWTKQPKYEGWQKTKATEAGIKTEWQPREDSAEYPNIAMQPLGLIVIDLDRVRDTAGEWAENPLYTAHSSDWFKTCPLQRSGSGGLHAVFKHPKNKPILKNSASSFAPGVDIRTNGGQLVLAPSRYSDPKHPEAKGNVYEWIRPLPALAELEEIPADLYDQLRLLGEQKPKTKPVELRSKSKLRRPNKKLTEKLTKWIDEDTTGDDSATCHLVARWLVKAFQASVKHDCVSPTFLSHPFIQDWLDRNPNQAGCWKSTVESAYAVYATPRFCTGLELPRSPLTTLPAGGGCKPSTGFAQLIQVFEQTNNLTLSPQVYGEIEHLLSLPAGKRVYELRCGGGKSIGSLAWVLFRKDQRFLIVKERKADLYALKSLLAYNGEDSTGLLVGFDEKSCTQPDKPNSFEAYDRTNSPCKACADCDFGKGLNDDWRNEQINKRILLITHKKFLSMMRKGEIAEDFTIIIDEGLKSIEDFCLTPEIERSFWAVFPPLSPGNKWLNEHLAHLKAKTLDGSCYLDGYDCTTADGDDYIDRLTKFCFKKYRREAKINPRKLPDIENCLTYLCFLNQSRYRAVMRTKDGLRFRSALRDMDLTNQILVLDGSASISRTIWKDFTIYRSATPKPRFDNTTIHAFPFSPTKRQLLRQFDSLKEKFLTFIRENKSQAWIAVNKSTDELKLLLPDLLAACSVTLTRGSIVGSNAARDCSHAAIACSIFTEVFDYALSAALYKQQTIPGTAIFRPDGQLRLNQWGFECEDLQHEFMRQYTDELYQTLLRGIIRTNPTADYHAFCFLSSEIIAANLIDLMPGITITDESGEDSFRLLTAYLTNKYETLQDFLEQTKLKPDDLAEIDRCKLILHIFRG